MSWLPRESLHESTVVPGVYMVALAGALGSDVITGEALAQRYALTPAKIEEKTGVTSLRRLGEGESLVDMARSVVLRALDHCGMAVSDVRGVFGSSNPTSEHLLPTFTAEVARAAGFAHVLVDHVGVGCCGGLQAMRNAYNQLVVDALRKRTGCYVVVVGDQTGRMLDWERKQTGTLFSEGVAALVLTNDPRVAAGYKVDAVGTRSRLGPALMALRMANPYAARSPGGTRGFPAAAHPGDGRQPGV